jgi:hypothetical protein
MLQDLILDGRYRIIGMGALADALISGVSHSTVRSGSIELEG